MSYIEFFGTLLNLACVWLVARKNILNWPIGIIGVILFGILFYQIQLYADFIEQLFYLTTGFWGWYAWTKLSKQRKSADKKDIPIHYNTLKTNIRYVIGIGTCSVILGYFISNLHVMWPSAFPVAASFPYLDAFTTVMSFAAQILLIRRVVESWVLWVIVDVIAIGLYSVKGVLLVAVLYAVFLVIASYGLFNWRRMAIAQKELL